MRNMLVVLVVYFSLLNLAFAEDFLVEEAQLPEGRISESQKESKTLIKINAVTYAVDSVPDVYKMQEAMFGTVDASTPNPLDPFSELSPEKRNQFTKTRMMFLEQIARVLTKTKLAVGAGSLMGEGFHFVKVKSLKALGKEAAVSETLSEKFEPRSQRVIESVLQSIDYKLWSQAPLLVDANEFGIGVSVGILLEGGTRNTGGGGIEELGLSFGYNKEKRAFVFEIYHSSEKFESSKSVVAALGIVGKAGIHFGRRDGAKGLKGATFYPPVMPGYSGSSPDYFSAGFSSSLGIPPSPFVDIMTYTNSFERTNVLRISVSPLVKGFVRMEIGNLSRPLMLISSRLFEVYEGIQRVVRRVGAPRCSSLFS